MSEESNKCSFCGAEIENGRCTSCGMPAPSTELAKQKEENKKLAGQLYDSAVQCVQETGYATTALLQRHLHIGYAVAATLMDMMEEKGVVGPYCGVQPREVLIPHTSPSQPGMENGPAAQEIPVVFPAPSPNPSVKGPVPRLSLAALDLLEGHDFEYICAAILSANGYSDVQVTQASGDYGIDILASQNGHLYAIQCKCYHTPVGNHAVQEAYAGAAYYGGRIPVVMTNQTFTSAANQMANKLGVELWGRNELSQLLVAYNNEPPVTLPQRLLRSLVKGLIGSPSSVAATLFSIFGLYNSIQTDGMQELPFTILACVICWFLLKGVFVLLGKKLLK